MAPGPIPPTPHRPGRRHTSFSPTQLRAYHDCPERYFREYIAHEKMPGGFHRGTLRGSAVHKTLARVFTLRKAGLEEPADARALAEQYLPIASYRAAADEAAWSGDVLEVLELVSNALGYVPADSEVLAVEQSFPYVLSGNVRVAGVRLIGKIDLILKHQEGAIEHIDFKTGWSQSDEMQQVICRIGVCNEFGKQGLPILSTALQLSTGELFGLNGEREVLDTVLREIVASVAEIWDATAWPARDNDRCAICQYRTTLCSIHGEWSKPNWIAGRNS